MKLRILAILMALMGIAVMAADRVFEETYPVDPGADFSLSSHKGLIKVSTDNGNTVRVFARIYVEPGEDDRAVEFTKIQTSAYANSVRIEVDYNRKSLESAYSSLIGNHVPTPYVDFEIVIPDDLNLKLESHKSRFEIDAPAGEVNVESHKGTGFIRGVRNDFELISHKGQFDVDIEKMSDLEIETHKGDMAVNIRGGQDFTLRGDTHKGDIEIEGRQVEYIKEKHHRGMHVREKFGNGKYRVRLETHKGRIRLNFLD